mgnify:CR=1 FL=1
MFIAVRDTKVIAIQEIEWMCRRRAKGLDKSDYWTWLESITTEDENGVKTYDFSGEDYEIVETEVDVQGFYQSGHIEGSSYHLKWDASKKEVVIDDTAKVAWELAEEWKRIRTERTRLLAESDWTQGADSPLTDAKKTAWATYRTSLRTLPEDQKSKTKYSDITWPTQPS